MIANVIELNVDSLMVVNVLTQNGRGSPMGRSLVEKIRHMIDLEWDVVVKHSYREENRCLDALENYGCSLSGDIDFFDSCLSQFGPLLRADVMGLSISRLISRQFYFSRRKPSIIKKSTV